MRVRRRTGLSAWQIRVYSDRGLLGPVRRTERGHRRWVEEQVELLIRIAAWRKAGLQVREIAALLKKDRSSVAKHLTRRKAELAQVIRVVDVLERAAASLDAEEEREEPTVVGCSGSPGRAILLPQMSGD